MDQASDLSWATAQTVHRLFQLLDDGQFERMADLFAPDGVWRRQGEDLVGPLGVLAAMRTRPATLVTRHLVTNMVVDIDGAAAAARYYVTVFNGERSDGPAAIALPHAIFVCEDRLVQSEDGWRFALRAPRLAFRRGA